MTIGFDKNAYALASDELQKRSRNHAEEFLKKANVVTSDELKAVKKEIRELKKMISREKEKP